MPIDFVLGIRAPFNALLNGHTQRQDGVLLRNLRAELGFRIAGATFVPPLRVLPEALSTGIAPDFQGQSERLFQLIPNSASEVVSFRRRARRTLGATSEPRRSFGCPVGLTISRPIWIAVDSQFVGLSTTVADGGTADSEQSCRRQLSKLGTMLVGIARDSQIPRPSPQSATQPLFAGVDDFSRPIATSATAGRRRSPVRALAAAIGTTSA